MKEIRTLSSRSFITKEAPPVPLQHQHNDKVAHLIDNTALSFSPIREDAAEQGEDWHLCLSEAQLFPSPEKYICAFELILYSQYLPEEVVDGCFITTNYCFICCELTLKPKGGDEAKTQDYTCSCAC